ncbi:MAG: putative periplasmic or secreted lipoprotein [Solidesulfovibrio magneticus str. Maddingley MBC34]|uniref:Putative periplasmic or secreted lipoprotein n=1 Tax=Solidesulfovibrio magneticus str. Maddingley MBC34 TaxID=1206767 RepID=K6GSC7_9BACT|nr:MAG: putative periplasmic or secreted lipoprotein [Solidesulfovibrio magneticus str. Maddingley MBC34]
MQYKYGILSLAALAVLITTSSSTLLASDADDRIIAAAKQSFVFETYLSHDNITVRSDNGKVTLIGVVSDESDKTLAKEIVIALPGVKSVDNQLTLQKNNPDVYSDAWLMAKIKSTLLFHRSVNGTATEVSAKDGDVILRGQATSTAQKDLTTEYAADIEGVKNVRNEMTITTPNTPSENQAKSDKRIGEKTMGQSLDVMNEAIDDASTSALVKTALLLHRSTSALNTTVNTKDGVVTLEGRARNAAEIDLAAKLTRDVHGVKRVVNNMTVEGKGATAGTSDAAGYFDDTVITSKVKAGIFNDPALKVFQISVQSSDGVVRLGGVVDSRAAVARAAEVTNTVTGVKSVTNNLTVK